MASYNSSKMQAFAKNTMGVTSPNAALDYGDTFLAPGHLKQSFGGCELTVDGDEIVEEESPERKKYRVKVVGVPSLYAGNPIRFTPVQVSAI